MPFIVRHLQSPDGELFVRTFPCILVIHSFLYAQYSLHLGEALISVCLQPYILLVLCLKSTLL